MDKTTDMICDALENTLEGCKQLTLFVAKMNEGLLFLLTKERDQVATELRGWIVHGEIPRNEPAEMKVQELREKLEGIERLIGRVKE